VTRGASLERLPPDAELIRVTLRRTQRSMSVGLRLLVLLAAYPR
jgi:hypothetical protein